MVGLNPLHREDRAGLDLNLQHCFLCFACPGYPACRWPKAGTLVSPSQKYPANFLVPWVLIEATPVGCKLTAQAGAPGWGAVSWLQLAPGGGGTAPISGGCANDRAPGCWRTRGRTLRVGLGLQGECQQLPQSAEGPQGVRQHPPSLTRPPGLGWTPLLPPWAASPQILASSQRREPTQSEELQCLGYQSKVAWYVALPEHPASQPCGGPCPEPCAVYPRNLRPAPAAAVRGS